MTDADSTGELNDALGAVIEAVSNSTHVWFRLDGFDLKGACPRRRTVGDQQIQRWQRAVRQLRTLPDVAHRVGGDTCTYNLLMVLAAHASPLVSLPAAAALVNLEHLPPYQPLCDLIGRLSSHSLEQYAYGLRTPRWWTRAAVGYRAVAWERLCVRLAEEVFPEPVLAALRNETVCADGLMPDIIIDDGRVERDPAGQIVRARHIIDAKSGTLPRAIAYADRCEVLEYWHAGRSGTWVTQRRLPCRMVYRPIDELAEMAGADIAGEIAVFDERGGHLRLYLLFLRHLHERGPSEADVAPYLEALP